MKYVILIVAALVVLGLGYIRLAPHNIAKWHVDPQTAERGPKPNQFLMRAGDSDADSPVFDMTADDLAQVFDDYVMSRPRVTRLAGTPKQFWLTYIQRSKWFGFPDYVSVRIIPAGAERSTLAVFSRSRYGGSDMGVNAARITAWVSDLRQIVAEQSGLAAE